MFTVRSQGSNGYALMITRKREKSDRSDFDGGPNVVCAVQLAGQSMQKARGNKAVRLNAPPGTDLIIR